MPPGAAGALPATGNYLYVTSDPAEFVGQGETRLFTPANATIHYGMVGPGFLLIGDSPTENYSVTLVPMRIGPRLQLGYYPNVTHPSVNNPTRGGLNATGNGNGCNVVAGWFVIDSIAYENDQVSSIQARFEQRCDGRLAALRGSLRWQRP